MDVIDLFFSSLVDAVGFVFFNVHTYFYMNIMLYFRIDTIVVQGSCR